MIQLLFVVVFAEGVVALLLMEKIGPLRELVMKVLCEVKPATVKTIAATMSVIFLSSFYSIVKIQNKVAKLGAMTPMDQVLWRTYQLEASLMGFSLFLLFLIDRMHHYLRKLIGLRGSVGTSKEEVDKLEKEKLQLKEKEEKAAEEIKRLVKEISVITENLRKLKLESKAKDKKVETAEAHVVALHKQSAELLLEYDRLLEDNQNLQKRAQGFRN